MDIENSENLIQEVKSKAIKSIKWSVLTELVPRIIVPVTTLLLVKILSPADFGLLTIATIFVGFAGMFQDFGLAKALIREKKDVEESADIVFWSNISLGFVFYFIIFASAPIISSFFHEPRLTNILRVLCFEIILSALISVQYAILQREFEFKKVFKSTLGFAISPVVVTIPLALLNFGVWALVFGSLSGYLIQAIILWIQSPWRPRLRFNRNIAKRLFGFGGWFTAEMFVLWVLSYGDSGAVGYFLNVDDVGIYYIAMTFTTMVFGSVFNPLLSIAYSSLSKLQHDPEGLKRFFIKITEFTAILCIPMGIGLILVVSPLCSIFFQEKWDGIGHIIALLSAMQMLAWLVGVNPTLYRAIGRPDANFKIGAASIFYYLPVYVLFAQFGLFIFCIGRVLVALVTDIIHIIVTYKLIKINPNYLLRCIKIPLVGATLMAVSVYGLMHFSGTFLGWTGILKLLTVVFIGTAVYFGALYIINKNYLKQFFLIFLGAVK